MKKDKWLRPLYLATVLALSACTPNQPAQTIESAAFSEEILPEGRTLTGGYLAARFAQRQQDWHAAQNYMSLVLEYDGKNDLLVQRTFLLALGAGNFEKAKDLAQNVVAGKDSPELALIFLSCEAMSRKDYAAALTYLEKLPIEGFGQYTKPLLSAWALAGLGQKDKALQLLGAYDGADNATYHMHAGLMEEMAGNLKEADHHYKITMAKGLDLHTALMISNFYERYGRPETVAEIHQGLDDAYPFNPFVQAMSLPRTGAAPEANIRHASEGAALAIFELASLLYEKRAHDSAQIYGNMVQLIDKGSPFAQMMSGDIAALRQKYGEAVQAYQTIPEGSPVYWLSRMRLQEVYELNGDIDKSVEILTSLTQNSKTQVSSLISLGDIYRRHEQFEKAMQAYDTVLAGFKPLTAEQWPVIYARGVTHERLGRWDLAEKDLLHALSFQPNNPMILNFLAYSWADQGVKLDKALVYAKQAASLRPHDGYILDSYGWTLFRLAQYQESIKWLEKAVEAVPDDSTLLDHLGDAYWQAGHKNEAQYRWKHANDLSADPAFKKTVQQKIRYGIVVPSQIDHQQAKL